MAEEVWSLGAGHQSAAGIRVTQMAPALWGQAPKPPGREQQESHNSGKDIAVAERQRNGNEELKISLAFGAVSVMRRP